MGRWTQYDEDEYRLPEGMTRIAYDADSGKYTFKDQQGRLYEGAQGAEFSEMTPVGGQSSSSEPEVEQATRPDGYQPLATDANSPARTYPDPSSAYRTLFPFLLVICVFLLLVWRVVLPAVSPPSEGPPLASCAPGEKQYWIQTWDTCWEIASTHGVTLERLREVNGGPKLNCEVLQIGQRICLPEEARGS